MRKQKLVVIGNGMAGVRAVEEILSRGGADLFEITMFGDEPYGNYNRILLSNVVKDPAEIFMNPLAWYEEHNIRLLAGERVKGIERFSRRVFGQKGTIVEYDKLIIATGSRAFIPPMENLYQADGQMLPGIFGFRTLDDCHEIIAAAKQAKTVAVIGGGLLGLEAARGLLSYGCKVHIIHLASGLMNAQLDQVASNMLKKAMETMGIEVHLNTLTTRVLGKDRVEGLAFKDGSTLACEMVVVSAGIRPNVEVAMQACLTVERAIVVDNHMRSANDRNIYVVGECAQHRGTVYGLVAPLYEQAKVLASHITDHDPSAEYHGSKLATKLKVMGVDVASMGVINPEEEDDEVVQFFEPRAGQYKKVIIRNGRLIGAILMGDLSKVAFLTQAFEKNTALPDERLSLLFNIGAPDNKVTYAEMPMTSQVCNCNGVSKGNIAACVNAGHRTPKSVMSKTRAGMGCGSCKALVTELVGYFCGGELEVDPTAHYYVPTVPFSKEELIAEVKRRNLKSVSSVFTALSSDGAQDPVSKPALASLLSVVWKGEYDDERDARFINDRVHGNIQKDGTFSVIPEMPGGICTPDELRRIAHVADKYSVPLLKLTGGQRIDLVGIRKEDLPAVWRDLDMPAGAAWGKAYRTCKSCIGIEFCRFGLGHSMNLATKIEHRFRGLDSPAKLKLATAGCPRNCSEAYVKDVGAVAVEGGKWEIYVGGAAGSEIRKGDLLCVVESEEEVVRISGRFIQFYRERAKYKERTYTFVPRVGIERLRSILVDDTEGIAAELDQAMEESVTATSDVWLERDRPKTKNQKPISNLTSNRRLNDGTNVRTQSFLRDPRRRRAVLRSGGRKGGAL